jgi:hypothetical protein
MISCEPIEAVSSSHVQCIVNDLTLCALRPSKLVTIVTIPHKSPAEVNRPKYQGSVEKAKTHNGKTTNGMEKRTIRSWF